MAAAVYNPAFYPSDDQPYTLEDSTVSPTNALFPPELSAPHSNFTDPALLGIPQQNLGHRPSISNLSDVFSDHSFGSINPAYLSRPPSLSPSMFLSSSQSPPSSASPTSNFGSAGFNDDFLLGNSFSPNELDVLLFNDNKFPVPPIKPGHNFYLPTAPYNAQMTGPTGIPNGGYTNDTIDMAHLVNGDLQAQRRVSVISSASGMSAMTPASAYGSFNSGLQGDMAGILQQLQMQQPAQVPMPQNMAPQWMPQQGNQQFSMPQQGMHQQLQQPQQLPQQSGHSMSAQQTQQGFNNEAWAAMARQMAPQQTMSSGTSLFPSFDCSYQCSPAVSQPAPGVPAQPRRPSGKPQPLGQTRQVIPRRTTKIDEPVVGKHNKTERRYRQKVQAAQANLRDAVPALRVLYGTSTNDQAGSTDIRAMDGTVDGLGEITRPNASAKATILIGARMYIEHLQQKVASLQRKVEELETFRSAVAGEDDLRRWQAEFEAAEALRVSAIVRSDDEDDEGSEDEEEEEELPRKRRQPVKKAKVDVGGATRAFAAFAFSFSLLPSASTVIHHSAADIPLAHASTGQVLSRLPLITAEHTSRLLARSVGVAPGAQTLVDWGWRVVVALFVGLLMGPVLGMVFGRAEDEEESDIVGKPMAVMKDMVKLGASKWIAGSKGDEAGWNRLAAGIVGGGELLVLCRGGGDNVPDVDGQRLCPLR